MKTQIKANNAIASAIALLFIILCWSNVLAIKKSDSSTKSIPEWSSEMEYQQFQESFGEDDSLKTGLLKAQNLAQQGRTEEASKIYTNLMEGYPNTKEVVQGWLMLNMKRAPTGEVEAIQTLDELAKQYPKNSAIIFWRMFLEAEHGQNEAAIRDVDFLIELQPDSAINYVAKGQICAELKRFEEASEAFERATTIDPKRPDVWGMKAGVLARLGKFDDALISAGKGIELNPNSFIGLYNRACVYSLKGDKANALNDLKKAIELDSSIKQHAQTDEDFKNLWNDEDFKNLTK